MSRVRGTADHVDTASAKTKQAQSSLSSALTDVAADALPEPELSVQIQQL